VEDSSEHLVRRTRRMDEALLMLSEFYGVSWPQGRAPSCAKDLCGSGLV
jgi:hypothetical protein